MLTIEKVAAKLADNTWQDVFAGAAGGTAAGAGGASLGTAIGTNTVKKHTPRLRALGDKIYDLYEAGTVRAGEKFPPSAKMQEQRDVLNTLSSRLHKYEAAARRRAYARAQLQSPASKIREIVHQQRINAREARLVPYLEELFNGLRNDNPGLPAASAQVEKMKDLRYKRLDALAGKLKSLPKRFRLAGGVGGAAAGILGGVGISKLLSALRSTEA